MADYRTHVITSSALGAVYGFASTVMLGFTGIQGALAGVLTGVSGMLPDLDSDSGRPIREVLARWHAEELALPDSTSTLPVLVVVALSALSAAIGLRRAH